MATKKAKAGADAGAAVPTAKGSAIVVTVQETGGKIVTRTFNAEDHGGDWRKVAAEFIETCKLKDGETNRAKYVSHAEVK